MHRLTSIACLLACFVSCQPDPVPGEYQADARAYATGQHEMVLIANLFVTALNVDAWPVDSFAPGVDIRSEVNGGFRQVRMAFGDSTLCTDGRVRKGSITLLADLDWPDIGSSAELIPNSYSYTSRNAEKGFLSANKWTLNIKPPGAGDIPLLEHDLTGLKWQFREASVSWRGSFRQITFVGFDTPTFDDDVILVECNTGVGTSNEEFILRTAPPLLWRGRCPVWAGGKAVFQQDEETVFILDFGQDECSGQATLTVGEEELVLGMDD
ncbi:MAG: hypothetical protein AB8F95_15220 [Bacteroidia bacterium]